VVKDKGRMRLRLKKKSADRGSTERKHEGDEEKRWGGRGEKNLARGVKKGKSLDSE